MKVLVTGAAGFIGFHTSEFLLKQGHEVFGYDSVNDYYDPRYKNARLDVLRKYSNFKFERGLLEDIDLLKKAWRSFAPTHVIHLAAQAGVRFSLENPMAYINSNVVGFQNIIDLARAHTPENFVYASSSSVYGGNKELPFSEKQNINNPISLYAATKASNELVATTYGNLYGLPSTGLRFFTVYGPIARPDMAMFKFADLMRQGKKLPVYNHGEMRRDFTYVDDIVQGIVSCIVRPEMNQVYNLGKGHSENLMDMIRILEECLSIRAELELMPIQLGDVPATHADISKAVLNIGYQPKTSLAVGVPKFAEWYKQAHL